VNKDGRIVVPHTLDTNEDYEDMIECVKHCQDSSSLIRYMDLQEIANFLLYVNNPNNEFISEELEVYEMKNYFESVKDINIYNIKTYYLTLLSKLDEEDWEEIYEYFQDNMRKVYPSNIYVTTKDAYTLTHGPTIYLAKDVEKVAKFYLQQSKIPDSVIEHIQEQVRRNDKICAEIEKLEKTFEDTMAKEVEKDKKMADDGRMPPEMKQLRAKIERLQLQIQSISMPEIYVPNSNDHLRKWEVSDEYRDDVFRPEIPDEYVIKLMQLNDVDPFWKLLLLIGVGVFMTHNSVGYVEIMKELAQQQKLLMILATDDYIYGTNYQFCHGYIGKDLTHLTQEKLIQALGRVGRNKQNKKYSVRMRDDVFLRRIFMKLSVKKEADMMNKLFST
jgi:hypothetical protein